MSTIKQHEGKKYLTPIHAVGIVHLGSQSGSDRPEPPLFEVDIYQVLEAFGVMCPARQHAIKKLLAAGRRGKGSEIDDLIGAKAAIERAIELQRLRELKSQDTKNPPE